MNKKGFTLVEILSVIVILGLVMVIVGTKGFGAFDNTKNKIAELNNKAVEEGAKLFLLDVANCDDDLDRDLLDVYDDVESCYDLKEMFKSDRKISFEYLREKEYITGGEFDNAEYNDTSIAIWGKLEEGKPVVSINTLTSSDIASIESGDCNEIANFKQRILCNAKYRGLNKLKFTLADVYKDGDLNSNDSVAIEYYLRNNTFYGEEGSYLMGKKYGNYRYGDVNLDGEINDDDISKLNEFIMAMESYTSIESNSIKYSDTIGGSYKKLIKVTDDSGTAYYFRGQVKDNYVEFNNMCFRIVGIEGNGGIRLILASSSDCSTTNTTSGLLEQTLFGGDWDTGTYYNYGKSDIKRALNNWYENNMSGVDSYISFTSQCIGNLTKKYTSDGATSNDTINYYYKPYYDLKFGGANVITLKCDGNKTSSSKVYTLNSYELKLAGADFNSTNYYLKDEAVGEWWLISPYMNEGSDYVFSVNPSGILRFTMLGVGDYDFKLYYRPVVTLNSNIGVTNGNGTKSNPYVVKTS